LKLPILLSVPHVGWRTPPEVEDICILGQEDVLEDGDVGADKIYYPIKGEFLAFVTTDIGRAIVDLNRADDDFRKDGVIKTHTCWDIPVYRTPPSRELIADLLGKYYYPYHKRLADSSSKVKLGIDAHTMASVGPPVGPDSGIDRPPICISNAGFTCPQSWIESLAAFLEDSSGFPVSINTPFKGGYIVRSHSSELPWIQIEYSRAPFISDALKSEALLKALSDLCRSSLNLP
jgi:N-formylglutamate amidohydrolase